mgnify:FL=1
MFLSTLILAATTLAKPYSCGPKLMAYSADEFKSNGDLIHGWYWLRKKGHKASWIFHKVDLRHLEGGFIYLNFHVLVGDTVNAGPGWSAKPIVVVIAGGKLLYKGYVSMNNPHRPTLPGPKYYVGGCGWLYESYGSLALKAPTSLIDHIMVYMLWSHMPGPGSTRTHVNQQHVAVNKDSCVIVFPVV